MFLPSVFSRYSPTSQIRLPTERNKSLFIRSSDTFRTISRFVSFGNHAGYRDDSTYHSIFDITFFDHLPISQKCEVCHRNNHWSFIQFHRILFSFKRETATASAKQWPPRKRKEYTGMGYLTHAFRVILPGRADQTHPGSSHFGRWIQWYSCAEV